MTVRLNKNSTVPTMTKQEVENDVFYEFMANGLYDLAIYMLGPSGLVQTWNKGAQTIMQYQSGDVLGKNFSMFYCKTDRDGSVPSLELEEATKNGRFEGAGWRVRKDGSLVWLEVVIATLRAQDGELKGFVKVARDGSTEKKKSDDLNDRQRQDMIEVSTPVLHLWQGILALPIVGTLDSARSRIVTERLLQGLATSGCTVAIIDISGVPAVDTMVAQYLMNTVAAARLMGAECIISGIRPEIAQTMVHLGVDLTAVKTKASMSRALEEAMALLNMRVIQDAQKMTFRGQFQ